VPFWQEAVVYAASLDRRSAALQVDEVLSVEEWVGETLSSQGIRWTLLHPDGSRLSSLGESSPSHVLLEAPGFYEIRLAGSTDWAAVNLGTSESDLSRVDEEELRSALLSVQSQPLTTDGFEAEPVRSDQDFWWLLLIIASLVLLGEAALGGRLFAAGQRRYSLRG
jgi:hypothetical protein